MDTGEALCDGDFHKYIMSHKIYPRFLSTWYDIISYEWTRVNNLPIVVILLADGQSYDFPSTSQVIQMDMGKLTLQTSTKYNKARTVCIIVVMHRVMGPGHSVNEHGSNQGMSLHRDLIDMGPLLSTWINFEPSTDK